VSYVLIETPASIVVKKAKFSRMIPAIAMAWGIVCLSTGFIENYAGLLVTRLLLGAAEGGLFPTLTLYLMSWYKREELARRMCFLFGAAALAGAFGGLIAYGILHMDGAAGYAGWRWYSASVILVDGRLYIIEGVITIVFGFACFWLLPNKPEHAYFLNAKDKENMAIRAEQTRIYMGREQFEWRLVRSAFKEFKLYIRYLHLTSASNRSAICQFGADVCLYGFSTFLPIIIEAMGYSGDQAQYLTIPGTVPFCETWG
jgi:MFS family permease